MNCDCHMGKQLWSSHIQANSTENLINFRLLNAAIVARMPPFFTEIYLDVSILVPGPESHDVSGQHRDKNTTSNSRPHLIQSCYWTIIDIPREKVHHTHNLAICS